MEEGGEGGGEERSRETESDVEKGEWGEKGEGGWGEGARKRKGRLGWDLKV